jgi:hypothetical protein
VTTTYQARGAAETAGPRWVLVDAFKVRPSECRANGLLISGDGQFLLHMQSRNAQSLESSWAGYRGVGKYVVDCGAHGFTTVN